MKKYEITLESGEYNVTVGIQLKRKEVDLLCELADLIEQERDYPSVDPRMYVSEVEE